MLIDVSRNVGAALAALRSHATAAIDFSNSAAAAHDRLPHAALVHGIANADVHGHLDAAVASRLKRERESIAFVPDLAGKCKSVAIA
jgi:hypothetical protein